MFNQDFASEHDHSSFVRSGSVGAPSGAIKYCEPLIPIAAEAALPDSIPLKYKIWEWRESDLYS